MKVSILIIILLFGSAAVFAQHKNIALNKPVFVTSEDKNFPAKHVTDGVISRNAKWQAGTNKAPHVL